MLHAMPLQPLPTPEEFLDDSPLGVAPLGAPSQKPANGLGKVTPNAQKSSAQSSGSSPSKMKWDHDPSEEFRGLVLHYCASMKTAASLEEVQWGLMAQQLGVQIEWLKSSAEYMNQDGLLWRDVINERIRRFGAAKYFRDVSWEKLESNAVSKLLQMMDRGLIRDPGELLAIAGAARRASGVMNPNNPNPPSGGNNMNLNLTFNGQHPEGDLPGAGTKIAIDLSPKLATSLARGSEVLPKGQRVIDSEMLGVKDLRKLSDEFTAKQQENQE